MFPEYILKSQAKLHFQILLFFFSIEGLLLVGCNTVWNCSVNHVLPFLCQTLCGLHCMHIISSGHPSIHVIFCVFQMYCRSSWFFLALLPELLIFFYMVSFMTTRKCFYNNFANKYTIKCCAKETHWLGNLYLRMGSIRWAKLETMQAWKQSHIS